MYIARTIIYFSSCVNRREKVIFEQIAISPPRRVFPPPRRHRGKNNLHADCRHRNPSVSEARKDGEGERAIGGCFPPKIKKKRRLEKLIKYNVNIEPRLVLLCTTTYHTITTAHPGPAPLYLLSWCLCVTYDDGCLREKEERNTQKRGAK